MGHYYSEMVSDEELEQQAKRKRERRERLERGLQQRIDEKGLVSLLADMVERDGNSYIYEARD